MEKQPRTPDREEAPRTDAISHWGRREEFSPPEIQTWHQHQSCTMEECNSAAASGHGGRTAHGEPKFSSGELVHRAANRNLLIRAKKFSLCFFEFLFVSEKVKIIHCYCAGILIPALYPSREGKMLIQRPCPCSVQLTTGESFLSLFSLPILAQSNFYC